MVVPLPEFQGVITEDLSTQLVQEELKKVLYEYTRRPENDSYLIEGETVVSGSNVLNHKLGRQPRGWYLVDCLVAQTPYREAWDDKTLTLNLNADTISLVVF